MKLNKENLSNLWDRWIGSKSMLIGLKPPVNFLGSQKKYKESFLSFVEEYIRNEREYDEHDVVELKDGKIGTIVHRYDDKAFEVEFARGVVCLTRDFEIKRKIKEYR